MLGCLLQNPQKLMRVINYKIICAMEKELVRQLGEKIGYGNMMQLASECWEEMMIAEGYPTSGVFIPALKSDVRGLKIDTGLGQSNIPDVNQRSELLIDFLIHLNNKGLINNHDFDYEKEAKKYSKKIN
jgi:hypothetical protein